MAIPGFGQGRDEKLTKKSLIGLEPAIAVSQHEKIGQMEVFSIEYKRPDVNQKYQIENSQRKLMSSRSLCCSLSKVVFSLGEECVNRFLQSRNTEAERTCSSSFLVMMSSIQIPPWHSLNLELNL
jgi:hypothetical protein